MYIMYNEFAVIHDIHNIYQCVYMFIPIYILPHKSHYITICQLKRQG